MRKHARPRIARHPASVKAEAKSQVPELKAADVLKAEHVYHHQFVKWLADRQAEHGEDAAQPNKRKARLFLALNPILRRTWPLIWKAHDRQENKNKKAA
jgi:hypothetical protein